MPRPKGPMPTSSDFSGVRPIALIRLGALDALSALVRKMWQSAHPTGFSLPSELPAIAGSLSWIWSPVDLKRRRLRRLQVRGSDESTMVKTPSASKGVRLLLPSVPFLGTPLYSLSPLKAATVVRAAPRQRPACRHRILAVGPPPYLRATRLLLNSRSGRKRATGV